MKIEWPTVGLIVLCYAGWAMATTALASWFLPLAICATALFVTLHASLTHEVIHGHPFRQQALNAALVWPALPLLVPYGRFRDTHLDHHMDANLTDPYEDPESNFHDPAIYFARPRWQRGLLCFHNTLAGRLLLGPLIGQMHFIADDLRRHRAGVARVAAAWRAHLLALMPVALWFAFVAQMPFWAYLLAVYASMSLLRLRTYLEHRAHTLCRARTVIVEERGPLALLFLNNNLHAVHHSHPATAWYKLPTLYAAHRDRYLDMNDGYRYRSYAEVLRRYFFQRKDPVPHPLLPHSE